MSDVERLRVLLPGYDIQAEIGRGPRGTVWAAEQRATRRSVAVKVLAPALTADPEVRRRFAVMARMLQALDHPHLVHVDEPVESELCGVVMTLCAGGTLRARMPEGGVRPDVATALAIAACDGLDHAHGRGVFHRDLCPENLMFTETGRLQVADAGIVDILAGPTGLRTGAGGLLARAPYVAPEQVTGGAVSPAGDVYALATVLYEMTAGQLPFPGESDEASLLHRHLHEQPMPLAGVAPEVPEPLARVVMRALSADPASRPATAEQLGVELADAALAAWGPGWVAMTGIEVLARGRIAEHLAATSVEAPRESVSAAPAGPRRRIRPALLAGAAAAVVALAVAVLLLHRSDSGGVTAGGGAGTGAAPSSTATSGRGSTETTTPAIPSPPAPTVAPTGRLVFTDPMTDPKSGWNPDPGQTNGTAAYQPDGYHIIRQMSDPGPLNTYSVASPFTPRLTALTIAVDAVIVAGAPADGAGVRCDQGNGRNGLRYTFEIHPDGSWLIDKIDGGGPKALAQGTSPAIVRGRGTNTVIGTCAETAGGVTQLTMAVNGVPLGAASDTHAPGPLSWHGALVTYRDAESPGTEIRFTNVRTFDAGPA